MKILIIIAICLLPACSSVPEKFIKQIEVATVQSNTFCKGGKLSNYIETTYYYSFTCEGNGSFFFLK